MTYRDDIVALRARVAQLEEALADAHRRLEQGAALAEENARLRKDVERLRAAVAVQEPEPLQPDVPNPRLVLEITDPDGRERTVRFDRDIIEVGRNDGCHLVLDDEGASRMHAVIELSQAHAEIVDLGSSTGTQINGERITRARLRTSDVIGIGDTTLTVWLSP